MSAPNPPCICDDIYRDACRGEIDWPTWALEEHHRVMYGHVASCHHRSPEPIGVLCTPKPPKVEPLSYEQIAQRALFRLFESELFRQIRLAPPDTGPSSHQ